MGRKNGSDNPYFYLKYSEVEIEKTRIDNALKSYVYYKNDLPGIQTYLHNYLSDFINSGTLQKMPLVVLNYVPKILKRLTLLYKKAPLSQVGDYDSKENELYQRWTRNLNKYRKEFHRQAKLFNTILVRPIPDEDKEQFHYLILNRGICEVETDPVNHQKLKQLEYQIPHPDKKDEDITLVWSADEYYAKDKNGRRITITMPDGTVIDGKNPYKRIPFVELRMEDGSDYWGDGMNDLVQANEHLCGRLSDTFFKLYMSFGVPFGVNLDIKADEFYISPDMPVMVNNAGVDKLTPSLDFISPDQKVELDRQVNDWFINELGIIKGLPAGAFAEGEKAMSGYAKMIDNLELMDLNEEDKDALREFEFELFDLQKQALEVETNVKLKGDLDFEFTPYDFPKSDDEIWLNREKEFSYNITTPIDWLREYRPDATDDELEQILTDNKAFNETLKRQKTRLESLISGRTETNI